MKPYDALPSDQFFKESNKVWFRAQEIIHLLFNTTVIAASNFTFGFAQTGLSSISQILSPDTIGDMMYLQFLHHQETRFLANGNKACDGGDGQLIYIEVPGDYSELYKAFNRKVKSIKKKLMKQPDDTGYWQHDHNLNTRTYAKTRFNEPDSTTTQTMESNADPATWMYKEPSDSFYDPNRPAGAPGTSWCTDPAACRPKGPAGQGK
jgi:hypothetical protein